MLHVILYYQQRSICIFCVIVCTQVSDEVLRLVCVCVFTDRRVASMTVEQLADLSRIEDVEQMADDLALQLGVESDRLTHKYSDRDIMEGLQKASGKDSSNR